MSTSSNLCDCSSSMKNFLLSVCQILFSEILSVCNLFKMVLSKIKQDVLLIEIEIWHLKLPDLEL